MARTRVPVSSHRSGRGETLRACTAFILLVAVGAPLGLADIVPAPGTTPVKPLFDKSDIVCKCFVKSLEVLQEEPLGAGPKALIRRRVRAAVEIQDSYKARDQGNEIAFVDFVENAPQISGMAISSGGPALWQGETALLFLINSQRNSYEFTDLSLGAISFHSFPQVNGEPGLEKLQHALAATVRSANRDDRIRALQLLQGFDSINHETLAAIDASTQSEDPETAVPALGVLLKTKTTDSIEQLKRYLDNYKSNVDLLAFSSIGSELSRIDNVKALGPLEALSSSHFIAIRHGAMDAIRRIKSPKSIPLLVARLDDSDSAVQYVALITLAEVLSKYDGDYAPSMYLFDKKPQYYVGLWKQWWTEEGSTLYGHEPAAK
jgi:hypothetical protein